MIDEMADALVGRRGATTYDADDLVALLEKEFREV
jgi:hypothetical protein